VVINNNDKLFETSGETLT